MRKHIFITGGVVSGLGKGIVAASLGMLLKARGFKVAAQKLDPYMNVDPGTMSPYQHGEVFVTEDGSETDLDLGHYERFIDEDLNRFSNLTSGRIYKSVIDRERRGEYLGQTVQIIPHVTNEIKNAIFSLGRETGADIVITEIGGTIGDIESQPFLEAAREIRTELGREDTLFVHVVLVPYLKCSGEHKTKPAQHSVHELQGMGIMPDVIIARSDEVLGDEILSKLALFCNADRQGIIAEETLDSIYKVPVQLYDRGLDAFVMKRLSLPSREIDLSSWKAMLDRMDLARSDVEIAIVGKYTALHDAYLSVIESLKHAGIALGARVHIRWVESEALEKDGAERHLSDVDAILVPGGFGQRGMEGMVEAARYARKNDVPYFGICLGMQIAVIEVARDLAGLDGANSREFDPDTPYPVIDLMENQEKTDEKGGTMRLGSYPCRVVEGTLLHRLYGKTETAERHRHRYEVSRRFRKALSDAGVVFSGLSPDGTLVEAMEIPANRFFVAVQFHPEFKSRPNRPHPIFLGFVESALSHRT